MHQQDSDTPAIPTLLYGTVNGVIGVIASLPQERVCVHEVCRLCGAPHWHHVLQFQFLEKVQKNLTKVIKGVGGFEQEEWRSFRNERKTVESRQFLDGDLIERFLDLKPRLVP